jgi:hypothetical protein
LRGREAVVAGMESLLLLSLLALESDKKACDL